MARRAGEEKQKLFSSGLLRFYLQFVLNFMTNYSPTVFTVRRQGRQLTLPNEGATPLQDPQFVPGMAHIGLIP